MKLCLKRLALCLFILGVVSGCDTDIHTAVEHNDIYRVRKILDEQPEKVDELSKPGDEEFGFEATPLQIASSEGFPRIVELLLSRGAEVNGVGGFGISPLCFASEKSRGKEVAELLIANGADVNAPSEEGLPPLHCAALFGKREIVELLLKNGADVNLKDEYDFSALYNSGGCYNILYNPSKVATKEWDKLQLETSEKCLEVARLLIESGADVNNAGMKGWTPLHYMVFDKVDVSFAELLIENGAEVNSKDNAGNTPLHQTARFGKTDLVKLLLDNGARVNEPSNNGKTPLHLASKNGNIEIVKLLIEKGGNIHAQDNKGCTSLHSSSCECSLNDRDAQLEVAKFLVSKGADINARNKEGKTPLTLAKERDHAEIINFLIEAGGIE